MYTLDELKHDERATVEPCEVMEYAAAYMEPGHIDHYDPLGNGVMGDLYLKVTPVSRLIVKRLHYTALLSTFIDGIDGELWYEFPFCWHE